MMKRVLILVLAILLVLVFPVYAVVRELDAETETRLTDRVLEQYPNARIESTRIWDFWNIEHSVFCLTLDLDGQETEVYIDIETEEILSADDMEQLQAQEEAAQEDDTVPYPDTVLDPAPGSEPEQPESGGYMLYWLGGIVVFALGALVIRKAVVKKA